MNEMGPSNFERLVLGCIDSYDSESRRILQHFSRSTGLAFLCTAQTSKIRIKISHNFAKLNIECSIEISDFFLKNAISHSNLDKNLKDAPTLAIVAVDTAENEPLKI